MASIGTASLDAACAPHDPFPYRVAVSLTKNGLHGKRPEQEFVARLARKIARDWRRLLALALSCGTPWISADNAKVFPQSQLATA
jgi:hypothetical protein